MTQSRNLPRRPEMRWPPALSPDSFPVNRIDLWRVSLDSPATEEDEASVLSSDEIARANRFHFEKDRLHFIRCRAALRRLLGKYLTIPADEVRFQYLTNGKPQLGPDQNPHSLQFNVSHSAGLALIAFGTEHGLGVDIEKIRADVDTAALSERFFSSRERAGLQQLPEELRVSGFFACWTRKEAFLKATGEGLSFPLADFSVSTHPDRGAELKEIKGNVEAGKQWFLADLTVSEEYRAALALQSNRCELGTFTYAEL
jgi:4'-phosphopantetheinyl transferase